MGVVLLGTLLGCGADATDRVCVASEEPPEFVDDDDADVDSKADQRMNCEFGPGDTIDETVDTPPDLSVVKHVFVILRENRSFDHYLGAYEGREQDPPLGERSNPDPSTRRLAWREPEEHYCTRSPAHEWNAVHLQFNNGKLDGFVAATNVSERNNEGCVAMGFYTRRDIPLYYWLADEYAISERYHSSLLGPTMPNIMFYYYASSCNSADNIEATTSYLVKQRCRDQTTIFELIRDAGRTAKVYSDNYVDLPVLGVRASPEASAAVVLAGYNPLEAGTIADFQRDVQAGTLADVVFIEPNYKSLPLGLGAGTQNDEHPPSNIQDGQNFVLDRITEIMGNDAIWQDSVIFITWDEHGGYYDHVVPPTACAPDPDATPLPSFDFGHLGFRTPFFAISPFAKRNYVSRNTADHTSITRFIEAWLGLGALTARDANAWPLFDMFDFTQRRSTSLPPASARGTNTNTANVGMCGMEGASSSCVR